MLNYKNMKKFYELSSHNEENSSKMIARINFDVIEPVGSILSEK